MGKVAGTKEEASGLREGPLNGTIFKNLGEPKCSLANCSDPRSENLLFPECGPMAVNSPVGASGKLVSPGPYQFPAQQGLCPVVS